MSAAPLRLRLAAAALALAAATQTAAEPIKLRAKPIEDFTLSRRDDNRHGRLEFLGGLELGGPRGFGGLSGLLVDGTRLTAVTDAGHFFTARLQLDGNRLVGIENADLTRRMDLDGTPATAKARGDAEALTVDGGTLLVAVEAIGALLAYPFAGGTVPPGAIPSVRTMPRSLASAARGGLEALATLPDGTVLVFAEGRRGTGPIPGASRDDTHRFAVARHGTFAVTGADALPGGDVILAERRYDGGLEVGMRIRRIGADAFTRKARTLDGPILLETDLASEIDNIEAIAAQVQGGDIVLTLLSDDNFNLFQRTLLLRFRIADPVPRPKPARPAG